MYKTGDLSRYLESGDVEPPPLRNCKTLVRRDRNEEQTLVSYIVPEAAVRHRFLAAGGIEGIEDEGTGMLAVTVFQKKYKVMQKEVRGHPKTRLPAYAVPNIYIVLNKLSLNPDGEVEQTASPFPRYHQTRRGCVRGGLEELGAAQGDAVHGSPKVGGPGPCAEVEKQRKKASGVATEEGKEGDPIYAQTLDELVAKLPATYRTADSSSLGSAKQLIVFLAGAFRFLGSYLVKDILESARCDVKLVVHVRAVEDTSGALERLKRFLGACGLWREERLPRLSCVIGDLSHPKLGMSDAD
ncbi:hypothetical protein ANO14919_143790 [Xylariales sp. No.14919]|nr:hypothetical protein ANO14919_143790 [Xylariales sp. No.14919]